MVEELERNLISPSLTDATVTTDYNSGESQANAPSHHVHEYNDEDDDAGKADKNPFATNICA